MSFNNYQSDDDDDNDDNPIQFKSYVDKNGMIGGGKKKNRNQFTKYDNIYGVFGNDYDDYDEDGDKRMDDVIDNNDVNYKPIYNPLKPTTRFVPSGIYDPNTAMKSQQDDDRDDKGGGQTSTTTTATKIKKKKNQQSKEERDRDKFDSKFGKKKNQQRQEASSSGDVQDVKVTGIGRKLLEKMGYIGTGDLRGDGSGIAEPIRAYARPQGAGLSSSFKTDKQFQSLDESGEDEEEDEEMEEEEKATRWKKTDKKEKMKYDIREHMARANEKSGGTSSVAPQVIVDMTGPTTMLRTTDTQKKDMNAVIVEDSHGPMTQLKYNIALLIRMKNIDRQNINSKVKFEGEKIDSLTNNVNKLKLVIEAEDAHRKKIESLKEIIGTLQRQLEDNKLTLSTLFKQFVEFQTTFKKEYIKLKLYNLEKEFLRPLLIKKIESWSIEKDQKYLVDEMLKWKSLFDIKSLDDHRHNGHNDDDDEDDTRQKIMMNQGSDIYFILIRDLILPVIKNFIRTRWKVKDNTPTVVSLIGHWSVALPEVILDNILEQSIFPRLKSEVSQWNPLTDPVPIDQWLHPWIPFLKNDLESLYPQIRQTLISVLGAWDIADQSALALLSPWKGVFEGNSMDSLLNRSITPKFSQSFSTYPYDDVLVDTSKESLYPIIEYFDEWSELMSPQTMITILSKQFFPIWIESICKSLKQSQSQQQPSISTTTPQQLLQFYQYWRNQFKSSSKMDQNIIKYYFNIILDLIEQYLNNDRDIKPKTNYNILPTIINSNQKQKQYDNISSYNNNNNNNSNNIEKLKNQINHHNNSDGLLKDSLEELAKELGMLFIPTNMSTDAGNQIYKFGTIPIVLDKGVIMFYTKSTLEPANINLLLDKVQQQQNKM